MDAFKMWRALTDPKKSTESTTGQEGGDTSTEHVGSNGGNQSGAGEDSGAVDQDQDAGGEHEGGQDDNMDGLEYNTGGNKGTGDDPDGGIEDLAVSACSSHLSLRPLTDLVLGGACG